MEKTALVLDASLEVITQHVSVSKTISEQADKIVQYCQSQHRKSEHITKNIVEAVKVLSERATEVNTSIASLSEMGKELHSTLEELEVESPAAAKLEAAMTKLRQSNVSTWLQGGGRDPNAQDSRTLYDFVDEHGINHLVEQGNYALDSIGRVADFCVSKESEIVTKQKLFYSMARLIVPTGISDDMQSDTCTDPQQKVPSSLTENDDDKNSIVRRLSIVHNNSEQTDASKDLDESLYCIQTSATQWCMQSTAELDEQIEVQSRIQSIAMQLNKFSQSTLQQEVEKQLGNLMALQAVVVKNVSPQGASNEGRQANVASNEDGQASRMTSKECGQEKVNSNESNQEKVTSNESGQEKVNSNESNQENVEEVSSSSKVLDKIADILRSQLRSLADGTRRMSETVKKLDRLHEKVAQSLTGEMQQLETISSTSLTEAKSMMQSVTSHQHQVNGVRNELGHLADFYDHFVVAQDAAEKEVERRWESLAKMEQLAISFQKQLDELYENELQSRLTFNELHGQYLPRSLCPALAPDVHPTAIRFYAEHPEDAQLLYSCVHEKQGSEGVSSSQMIKPPVLSPTHEFQSPVTAGSSPSSRTSSVVTAIATAEDSE